MSTPEVIDIHIGTRQDFVTPMEERSEIAREQAGMMADQLVRVARRGGTK